MRWQGRRESERIEDRRGGGGRVGRGAAGLSGGGILLLLVFAVITGRNPLELLQLVGGGSASVDSGGLPPAGPVPEDDEQARFISVVLADTEETWTQIFGAAGQRYELPILVLFDGSVDSACGYATAASGPFYCPADAKVYLDLSFFRELETRFAAPGDFARAYVVAHEVGHHVQNLLRISGQVQERRQQVSERESNALSVRLELQADCLAGVWAHHASSSRNLLEEGDVDEGLAAAAAVGDDSIQRQAGVRVRPESWTHGSAADRATWFRRGLQSGDVDNCDTFGGG